MSTTIVPADKSQLTREEINRKQKEYIFPSVSTYYSDPLPMDRASMQHVWDVEGKKYLDFFGGIVTISVGHCNPRVTSRTKEQIDRMQHVSTCFPNVPMVDLAEKLAQITPGALKKSYFTNSGTEANETAIQVARMHTGNFEVVALRHGYSGRSSLTRGLTGMHTWRKGTIEVGIVHAMNPYCYRCPLGLKYPPCEVACAKDIESVIQFSTSGRIAAFLAEPIQGVGGFITPPKEYFKLAFNNGLLVTLEEIVLGFALAALAAFVIGTLISQVHLLELVVYPYIVAIQTLPKVAVAPLILIWVGLGIEGKILIAATVSFFPMLVNTIAGLRSAPQNEIDLMRSLSAFAGRYSSTFNCRRRCRSFLQASILVLFSPYSEQSWANSSCQGRARLSHPADEFQHGRGRNFRGASATRADGYRAFNTLAQYVQRRVVFWQPSKGFEQN